MNNTLKMTLAAAVALGATSFSTAAMAGASANIGVVSDYVWRGMTQNGGDAAIQGGLDYEADNGFYVGTWVSPVAGGSDLELDIYGGYAGETAGGFGYDVGAIGYIYPKNGGDFYEVYANGSYGAIEGGVAYTFDSDDNTTASFSEGDIYYFVGASKEIKPGLSIGGTVGKYDFDNAAGGDYTNYQLSLSKDDFTFAVDDTDVTGSKPIYSVAWSKSFDL